MLSQKKAAGVDMIKEGMIKESTKPLIAIAPYLLLQKVLVHHTAQHANVFDPNVVKGCGECECIVNVQCKRSKWHPTKALATAFWHCKL